MPRSKSKVVAEAKDLNPFRLMLFKYTGKTYLVMRRILDKNHSFASPP
jgi:hypothetical protein